MAELVIEEWRTNSANSRRFQNGAQFSPNDSKPPILKVHSCKILSFLSPFPREATISTLQPPISFDNTVVVAKNDCPQSNFHSFQFPSFFPSNPIYSIFPLQIRRPFEPTTILTSRPKTFKSTCDPYRLGEGPHKMPNHFPNPLPPFTLFRLGRLKYSAGPQKWAKLWQYCTRFGLNC